MLTTSVWCNQQERAGAGTRWVIRSCAVERAPACCSTDEGPWHMRNNGNKMEQSLIMRTRWGVFCVGWGMWQTEKWEESCCCVAKSTDAKWGENKRATKSKNLCFYVFIVFGFWRGRADYTRVLSTPFSYFHEPPPPFVSSLSSDE